MGTWTEHSADTGSNAYSRFFIFANHTASGVQIQASLASPSSPDSAPTGDGSAVFAWLADALNGSGDYSDINVVREYNDRASASYTP